MDRVKAYSWLLTVVMGLALTTALKELTSAVAEPITSSPAPPLAPTVVRFTIFLVLSVRWTMGVLWYFDRAYVSKSPPPAQLGHEFFLEFFVILVNFGLFVPLAVTITDPPAAVSRLSAWLNKLILGGKEASTFVWLLVFLLVYDFAWFLLKFALWAVSLQRFPRRVYAFWGVLNFVSLMACVIIFLFYGWRQWDLQAAEVPILYVILIASLIDIAGTIVETSALSQWLSP